MQVTPPPAAPTGPTGPSPANLSAMTAAINDLQGSINNAFNKLGDRTAEIESAFATNTAKMAATLGVTQQALLGFRQEMAIALPGIEGLGGELSDVANIQMGIAQELNRNLVTLGETTEDLFVAGKAVGVASGNIGAMVEGFQSAGIQTENIRDNIEKTVEIAQAVGVNTSAVFKLVQDNLSNLNRYGFQNGTEGLARMSAQAAGLRINMREIFDFAERVFNPEGAIETVAAFQRLGVAAGDLADPFRLMYLASEDTEELQNQIVKMTEQFTYFDETTKEFKVFPNAKRDLREISKETGIAYDELVKMSIGQQKLNAISKDFRIAGIDEESQQFVANLAEYSKEKGGFTVQVEGQEKLVSELSPDDLDKLKKASETVTLEDIAQAQLTEQEMANALLAKLVDSIAAPAAGAKPLQDTREVLRGLIGGATEVTDQLVGNTRAGIQSINSTYQQAGSAVANILQGNGSVSEVMSLLSSSGSNLVDGFNQMKEKLNNFNFEEVGQKYLSSGNLIKQASDSAVEGLTRVSSAGREFVLNAAGITSPVTTTTVSPASTTVNFADINYRGTIDVNVTTPSGALGAVPNIDDIAFDLFRNSTFTREMNNAINAAVGGSSYSLVPSSASS